jgi:hypothetical protein
VDLGRDAMGSQGGARDSTGSGWVEIEVEEVEDDLRGKGRMEEPEDDEISVLGYYTNRESRATIMQTTPAIEEVDDMPVDKRYGGGKRRENGRRRYP